MLRCDLEGVLGASCEGHPPGQASPPTLPLTQACQLSPRPPPHLHPPARSTCAPGGWGRDGASLAEERPPPGVEWAHRMPPRRPLLAGRPGAGPALFQPPATQHVQAGPRRGAWVFARCVTRLALWAAPLGRHPRPGPMPVSRGAAGKGWPLPEAWVSCLLGTPGPWLLLGLLRGLS